MTTIAATATAVPPYVLTRADVKAAIQEVFALAPARVAAMEALIDHTQVEQRHAVFPIDYLVQPRSLRQTSQEYQEHAIGLGRRVTRDCLAQAQVQPHEVDILITLSCTGYMIPSLDAHLINDLGFRPATRRLPITELGCSAGAMALSFAHEMLRGAASRHALIVAVELPSLTFQRKNDSQANLISSAIFGDGAAAVLLTNEPMAGPRILATTSHLVPNTIDAMGFDLHGDGFHIVLSKDIPGILRSAAAPLIAAFLEEQQLAANQPGAVMLHPGGRKILEYLEEALGLDRAQTQPSWDVLRTCGNLSSASILFVLHEWLNRHRPGPGEHGLIAAFGPGLHAELLLVEWD